MKTVQIELKRRGWESAVFIDESPLRTRIEVIKSEQMAFIYEVRLCEFVIPGFAFPERETEVGSEEHYYRAEVFLREGGESYDVYGYSRHNMITDILDHFERYLHKLHHSSELLPWNIEQHEQQLQPNQNLADKPEGH